MKLFSGICNMIFKQQNGDLHEDPQAGDVLTDYMQDYNSKPKTSTGWIKYSALPYAKSWIAKQPQAWVMEKREIKSMPDAIRGAGYEGKLVWRNKVTGKVRYPKEKSL